MSPLFKSRPGATDVAKRALCLAMVFRRFQLEDEEISPETPQQPDDLRTEMLDWARKSRVWDSVSRIERVYMLEVPVGKLDPQARLDAAWRLESLGVLTWSMSLREMLPYDVQFPVVDLGPLFPFGSRPPAVDEMIRAVRLRAREEIDRQRDIAEAWHWRSRTAQLQKEGNVQPPAGLTFEEIIRKSAEWHHSDGEVPTPIGADFPAFGKPYRDLTDKEYSFVTSLAMERHYALNWLCGYSKDWDKVPTDT